MQALIYTKYGSAEVLQYAEVEKPTPQDNEVLIKVQAVSLNSYDWHLLKADPFLVRTMGGGFFKPAKPILGADVAGVVEAVGIQVTQFKPGDEVFGDIAGSRCGGLAEYACATEKMLALKPAELTFEQAAAIPMAALTALQGLRDDGKVQPGHKVLVNGAAGGVGTYAVQIAKAMGAEVTAVCSTRNLEQARSLGADHAIDYTQEDFTHNGQSYDVIYAANGYHPIGAYKRALAPQGIYIAAGGQMKQLFQAIAFGSLMSKEGGKKLGVLNTRVSHEDLTYILELIGAGKVTPVIDRVYPFREAVEAFRYLGEGHARGKIVITIA